VSKQHTEAVPLADRVGTQLARLFAKRYVCHVKKRLNGRFARGNSRARLRGKSSDVNCRIKWSGDLPVCKLELRRTPTLQDVDDFFVDMTLRMCRCRGRKLQLEHIAEIAPADVMRG
jgi:hypothetical protein